MRKLSFFFLVVLLVFAFSFSALADVVASSSDASKVFEDFSNNFDEISNDIALSADDDISLASENDIMTSEATGLPSVINTVNYSGVSVGLYYYDVYKKSHLVLTYVDSDGWFNLKKPDDYAVPICTLVRANRSALPPSGKYSMAVRLSVQGGGSNYFSFFRLYFDKAVSNASYLTEFITVSGQSNYTEWYVADSVSLPVSYSHMNVYAYYDDAHSFGFPFNGVVKINFTRLSSNASTSVNPTVGNDINDTANDTASIADNTARQVEQGDSIIELIKNTIQTISSQLESFWNQLAGEFTNLYNKMNEQHSEDLAKVDQQIAADRENTDDIINNQDQNTDQITNGYDSSGMDSNSNKLNDSLSSLEDQESMIHEQAFGWIKDFTLPSFDQLLQSGGILAACLWLGQFWQSLFTNMGAFNIPVTLSLSLIFVLMLVGYHRFKR